MKTVLSFFIALLIINTSFAQTENCLEFNGYSNYVLVGDENNFGTSDFTIEAWVYFDHTFNSNGYKIINKGNTSVGTPSNAGYSLRGFSTPLGTDLDFTLGHSNGTICRITYDGLTAHNWYHIAGVRKGRELSLYVDGFLVEQETFGLVCNVDTDMPLAIGAIHKGGLSPINEYMDGKIDEVRFWSEARTETQLFNSKDCAINLPTIGLVTVYNFDQFNSIIALDASGNSINGTLVNNPNWISSTVALQCVNSVTEQNIINYIYINNSSSTIKLIEELQQGSYVVYGISGRIVTELKDYNGTEIALSDLSKGIYFIEVKNNANVIIGKEKFIQF